MGWDRVATAIISSGKTRLTVDRFATYGHLVLAQTRHSQRGTNLPRLIHHKCSSGVYKLIQTES